MHSLRIRAKLVRFAQGELKHFREEALRASLEERERHSVAILVRLNTAWEHYVRAIILDAARWRTQKGGSNLVPKGSSQSRAAHILVTTYPKRRTEPDWYLPRDALDAANRLNLPSRSDISLVLGLSPWPLEALRLCRNFQVHKSYSSVSKLKVALPDYFPGYSNDSAAFLLRPVRGNDQIGHWVDRMEYLSAQLSAAV